jgi:hypothetical protein
MASADQRPGVTFIKGTVIEPDSAGKLYAAGRLPLVEHR